MSPANGDIWPDIELQMPVDSGRATLSNPNLKKLGGGRTVLFAVPGALSASLGARRVSSWGRV